MQPGVRMILHGLLVLTLVFSGGAPDPVCSSSRGLVVCGCGAAYSIIGSDPESGGATAIDPSPVADSAKTERKSVTPITPAGRVFDLAVGTRQRGQTPHQESVPRASQLYVRHCALLC
ncbi:hypothetical protein ABI59_22510 [Acidobacteria bacterium Mor1]|nr:hypothetical protein ABI59_22510 [Acidobacteria bacterium Mor1]